MFVTKVLAIWKVLTVTWCLGRASGRPSSAPIMKLPPGMVTHSMPAPPWGGAAGLTAAGWGAAVDVELPCAKHGHGNSASVTAMMMRGMIVFYTPLLKPVKV